jgi:hypothetical protein
MVRAACHCTQVRFELAEHPVWVLDCNCTSCRRAGALWCYTNGRAPVTLAVPPAKGLTDVYRWGDEGIAFQRCKTCGCLTHMQTTDEKEFIFGLNARMIPTLDPAKTRVVQMNNSHSGWFWTKSDQAPMESHHPKMPMPAPEDWR